MFATPEAAFDEYRDAWTQKDLPRLWAVTDFRQSARDDLRRQGLEPDDQDVVALAAKREAELRTHLETRGFIPTFDECAVINVFHDSATQVRFLINRKVGHGEIFVPMRVIRFAEGWRVVYGG
jgi:hypothetical protein